MNPNRYRKISLLTGPGWFVLCLLWMVQVLAVPVHGQIHKQQLYTLNQESTFPSERGAEEFRSLKDVLEQIEASNNVSFLYNWGLIENKSVKASALPAENIAEELPEILDSFGLTYQKHTDRTYLILEQERAAG